MAYNAVAQRDDDFMSEFSGSPPLSPQEFCLNLAFRPSSSGLVPQPPRSEPRSHESSGPMHLRHPTPDLQSLQGAYVKNVERLEQSAARLSMSSDIGEELRKLKLEQRKSESRGSSLLGQIGERDALPFSGRQASHGYGTHASGSIVSTNNFARSGGFSPSAYFPSPRSSIRSGTLSHNSNKGRSGSQGSRLAQMSTSENPRPLESMRSRSFVPAVSPSEISPNLLRIMNNQDDLDDVEIPRPLNISPHKQQGGTNGSPDRPATAASVETCPQANNLFDDFDGVHIATNTESPPGMHESANDNPVSIHDEIPARPKSCTEPPPGDNLVYYPAPVPMMLNLPQRLSRLPAAPQREKRRSEVLGGLPANARKSAAWLPNVLEGDDEENPLVEEDALVPLKNSSRQNLADLPPQLRASVFFDYPAARQDVKVKGESAVATLDSILDASAFAPVSAFTDHPIVGHVGAEIYSKSISEVKASSTPADQTEIRKSVKLVKKRNRASDLLEGSKRRNSSLLSLGAQLGRRKSRSRLVSDPLSPDEAGAANLQSEDTPLRHLDDEQSRQVGEYIADEDEEFNDAQEELAATGENGEDAGFAQYSGQPTTLLAELQLRKQQQKQRNRTAATAFPDGMRSTLLELDAVAHIQRQSRKQKHVTLAWEDPGAEHPGIGNQDDEDVPLGMLFPQGKSGLHDRAGRVDEDRPLGLIARREIEDNEPLSHRRARLRGEEPIIARNPSPDRRASMYTLNIPGLMDAKDPEEPTEIEGESLGQRRQRLRQSTSQQRPISGNFASEVMGEFDGLEPTDHGPTPKLATSKTPDLEEETLGERRKRLQAEREAKSRNISGVSGDVPPTKPPLVKRRSMADLLQAHPGAGARAVSNGHQTQWTQEQQRASTNYIAMASRLGMLEPDNRASVPLVGNFGLPYMSSAPGLGFYPNPMVYNAPMPYPMTGLQLGQPPAELDRRQRDMIDRWRQSIMH